MNQTMIGLHNYWHLFNTARRPTLADMRKLELDYDEKHGWGGYDAARYGDESSVQALGMKKGDSYGRVYYDPKADTFYWVWNHYLDADPIFDEEGERIYPEPENNYDAGDAACDRYHARKDNL